MAFDFTGDYAYIHGTSTVTHAHKAEAGTTTDSVAGAIKQAVKVQDQGGGWMLSHQDCIWFLPDAETTNDPREGDTITDGSDVWSILDAALQPTTSVWECRCVKER